jgi:hypothetical protein
MFFLKKYIINVIIYIKILPIMCVIIYSYIDEWETDKNTKFSVVRSLKYSVQLDKNQTHMEVLC